jgi:hypothetical protein
MTPIHLDYSIIKNKRYEIRLSDFDYTDTNNELHKMLISGKGDFGKLHIFKRTNGELFASDNVWYSGRTEPEEDFELIEQIDKDEFIQKYSGQTVELFDSLKYVKDNEMPNVIDACEYAINRSKKIKFIFANTKVLLYIDLYDGNKGVKVISQPIKPFEEDIEYELTVYQYNGDMCETYSTLDEAYDKAFEYLEKLMYDLYMYLDLNHERDYKSLLPSIKKKYIDDKVKERVKLYKWGFYINTVYSKMFKELNDKELKILSKNMYKLIVSKYKNRPKVYKFI